MIYLFVNIHEHILALINHFYGFQYILPLFEFFFKSHVSHIYREMVGEGQILSTDDYFYENGIYSHDVTKLTDAHEWNRKRGKNIK